MTSKTAFSKFKIRFNKLDTNFSDELSEKVFCELFNKAQIHYVNRLLDVEGVTKDNQSILQQILKESKLTGIHQENVYLVNIPDDWNWIIRVNVVDTKCENTLNCLLVQESNVGRLLQNDNWKPSVEWEETIYTLGDNKLRIYTDNFRLKECNLVYYRNPIKIDIKTGRDNIDNLPSQDVNPEWNDSIVEEIIDLAVLIASTDVSDSNNFSSKAQLKQVL